MTRMRDLKFYNDINIFSNLISKYVRKKSNKPFKSKSKINTVRSIITCDIQGKLIFHFTFEEDNSNVECWRCVEIKS
jgi:hypothetical protein